jgi:hypothetical protein
MCLLLKEVVIPLLLKEVVIPLLLLKEVVPALLRVLVQLFKVVVHLLKVVLPLVLKGVLHLGIIIHLQVKVAGLDPQVLTVYLI